MTNDTNDMATPSPRPPAPPSTSGLRMIATMGAIGLAAGVLIVLTFQLTLPTIEINKARALERAIFEVVPGATEKVAFVVGDEGMTRLQGEDADAFKYYACYDTTGELVGIAMEAAGQGFQDVLRLLYGYAPGEGAVVGMKVLESKETPGLGDKIEKDPVFRANFESLAVRLGTDGREIVDPITLVKPGEKTEPWQVEAITGATISSRAVATILRESTALRVPVIMEHLQTLEEGRGQ